MFRRIDFLLLGMVAVGLYSAGSLRAQSQTFPTIVEWTNGTLPHYTCGAPGESACFTGCANSNGISVIIDPYDGAPNCDLPAPTCTFLSIPPPNVHDFTFLVMTDVHLLNGHGITDLQHSLHAYYMRQIGSNGWKWSQSNAGFPDDMIARPWAVVSTGDETNDGQQTSLGAFRLLYESGWASDALGLQLFPGYGNHDVQNDCMFDNCALRMLGYAASAAACNINGVDPLSGNYSWDWGKYHMVQLNVWAGSTQAGVNNSYSPSHNETHGSGLPWLISDLATHVGTSGRPVIVFQHYGWDPFSVTGGPGDGTVWWTESDRQAFLAVIQPYNVAAIISGHDHNTGSYSIPVTDAQGNQSLLEDIVGGKGGQGGRGEFFVVRLTDQFLDLMPVQWSDPTLFLNVSSPYPLGVGYASPGVGNSRPTFFNDVEGCRKWMGPPLHVAPLSMSANADSTTITNQTSNTITGPFALRFGSLNGSQPALPGQIMFTSNCAAGPLYILGVKTQLAPGESETIHISTQGTNTTNPDNVVSIGGDYFQATPNPVVISPTQSLQVHVTTAYGADVPFVYKAGQPWLKVTADSTQTPANLTLSIDVSQVGTPLTLGSQWTTQLQLGSTNSAYPSISIPVSIAGIPVSFTSPDSEQIVVDGVSSATPVTFNWQLNSTHAVLAQTQSPKTGVQDRFLGWSNAGATNDVKVSGPLTIAVKFQQFVQVDFFPDPKVGGTIAPAVVNSDGYYAVGTPLKVTATANAGYAFSSFENQAAGVNPITVTPAAPIEVHAKFLQAGSYSISTSLGAAGSETIDGVTTQGPATVQWSNATVHTVSVPLSILSSPGTQYVFTNWSDGPTAATRNINAGSTVNFVAQYQQQFLVTVTATPAGGGSVSGGGWYNANTPISLTATATTGFSFTGFSGTAVGSQSPLAVTVSQPETVFASFAPGVPILNATAGAHTDTNASQVQLTITVTNNGPGAAESVVFNSITGAVQSGSGTVLALTAVPLPFTVLPGQSQSFSFNLEWPSTAARVAFTVNFSANGGAYNGKSTFYVLR